MVDLPKIPRQVPACPTASIAYSTWNVSHFIFLYFHCFFSRKNRNFFEWAWESTVWGNSSALIGRKFDTWSTLGAALTENFPTTTSSRLIFINCGRGVQLKKIEDFLKCLLRFILKSSIDKHLKTLISSSRERIPFHEIFHPFRKKSFIKYFYLIGIPCIVIILVPCDDL